MDDLLAARRLIAISLETVVASRIWLNVLTDRGDTIQNGSDSGAKL